MHETLHTKLNLIEKQHACNKDTPHDKECGRVMTTKYASTKKCEQRDMQSRKKKTIPDASNQSYDALYHKTLKTHSKIQNPK